MSAKQITLPCALTIAGSDSGCGAGIQADLKAFKALGVHGTSAITCLTAQNPRGVRAVQAASPKIVREQIAAVFAELRPQAMKTGMLYNRAIIAAVADALEEFPKVPLVLDPVMVATSGSRLLQKDAERILRQRLFPRAILLTPNLDEAAALLGRSLTTVEHLRAAARELQAEYGCAVLAKGGHLRGLREAVDIFWDGTHEVMLSAPFVRGVSTHGTGCTYSAAIAAGLARGFPLLQAVELGKNYITSAIANSQRVGKHWVLG